MAQIVLGQNDFLEQPQKDTYQIGDGRVTTREWRGPRELYETKWAEIESGQPERMSGTKGTPAVIEATYLPEDPPDDSNAIWELIPSPVDRPLATHPAFCVSASQTGVAEKIEKAIREGRGNETDWDAEESTVNMNDFRNLMIKGTDSFRMWSYVVRRTVTTSLSGITQQEDPDAGKVVPWSQIGIPSTVKFGQPAWNRWDGSANDPVPIDQWLVCPSTVRYERKRYTITTEWYGALKWYKILYQGGSALSTEDGTSVG